MEKLTMVVNSCDKYSDLWHPFFKLLKIQWPEFHYPIVLNTESKTYSHDGLDIRCLQLYQPDEDVPWSKRLIETLEQIDSKYILFILDDFFIISPVNVPLFNDVIHWMDKHLRIGAFTFVSQYNPRQHLKRKQFPGFEIIPKSDPFRISCNHGVWRKSYLLKCLKPDEDAWTFEINAGQRRLLHFEKYYRRPDDEPPIIEAYFRMRFGYGIMKGKWLWKNIELFKKYGIDVDFSIRGVMSESEVTEINDAKNARFDEFLNEQEKIPKWKRDVEEAKRYIPVKMRIRISKVKRVILHIFGLRRTS